MTRPDMTAYGAHWCPDCRRSKQFLGEHQIPYTWVDIEQDKTGEAFVVAKNSGKRIVPTIVFGDGSILVEPSNADLVEWRDADLGKRQLSVQRSDWNGHVTVPKGGRLRYVPLTVRLAAALRDHRHLRSSRVLCQADGAPLTRQIV